MKTRKIVLGVAGIALVVIALLAVGLLLGNQLWGGTCCGYDSGMMRGYGFPARGHMSGGGLGMILVWLLVLGGLGGLVWLVISLVQRDRSATDLETPLEILKRRYASGEIDPEEFERMKERISDEIR